MKKLLAILALIPAALFGLPQNIQKDAGALTQSFTVPSGVSISATGTGTIAATSVTGFSPASGKVLTLSNTLTFTGTDSSSVNFGAGGTVLYSGGSYVASIAGTTNQISASASTGAVTLSLAGPHAFTTLTSTALLLGAGTSPISASDLTYSTPTLSVPAGFIINGAGTITLTPTDAAATGSTSFSYTPSASSPQGVPTWGVKVQKIAANTYSELGSFIYNNGFSSGFNLFVGGLANGTIASPATAGTSQTVVSYTGYAYANSLWKSVGGMSLSTSSTWSDSDFSSTNGFYATTGGTNSVLNIYGKTGSFVFSPLGSTTSDTGGEFFFASVSRSHAAWGVVGGLISVSGATLTDSSSSGTVATAVANSFAVPTFAASSATVFTSAANVYIAGDVAAGTNVTLTASYGLWNVGKTRLDGIVTLGGGATLVTTRTALTDGAGASVATFTNAPSAGNPTKWIGINDNGTTRYVPAW